MASKNFAAGKSCASDTSAEHSVWKAVQLVDGKLVGDPVVLKDTWVDSDREREGDVYDRIAHSFSHTDESEAFGRYFVEIQLHGDVLIDSVKDCTQNLTKQQSSTDSGRPYEKPGSLQDDASPCMIHYRLILKDVGTKVR